jgi:hypothetical protein
MKKLSNKAGLFMKILLCHNIMYVDFLFLGSILLCYKQGIDPTGVVQSAVVFYGLEGIVSGAIKVFKTKFNYKKGE